MKKNWKILLFFIGATSIVSMVISIPLILTRNSGSFTFENTVSQEIVDIKEEISQISMKQKEMINKSINDKKFEDENEFLFLNDSPDFAFEEVNELLYSLEKLNLKSEKLDSFKKTFERIKFEDFEFEFSAYLPNMYRYINIFNHYKIPLPKEYIKEVLKRNYDEKTGLFTRISTTNQKENNDLFTKLILSFNLFNTLKNYSIDLFNEFFSEEKIEKLFLEFRFNTDTSEKNIQNYNEGRIILLLLNFFPNKVKIKNLLKQKQLVSWITEWDKKISENTLENRILFYSSIKNIENLNFELKNQKTLEQDIVKKIKENNWDSIFINYILDNYGVHFLEKNNVLDITTTRIMALAQEQKLYFYSSTKNTLLSLILNPSIIETLNKNKILNFIKNRYDELKKIQKNSKYSKEWYYFTLLVATFFKDKFEQWNELVNNIMEIINTLELENIRFLVLALNIIDKANVSDIKISINPQQIDYISGVFEKISKRNPEEFDYLIIFSLELDKIFQLNHFDKNFIITFLEKMKRNDGGFGKNNLTKNSSIISTFFILEYIRKYFKNDEEIANIVKNITSKYIDKQNFDKNFSNSKKIESFYFLLSIKKTINNL